MVSPGLLPWAAALELRRTLRQAGCPDWEYEGPFLVELVTGRQPRFDETPLSPAQAERLEELARKRCQRVPLQYLSGKWDFLNVTLKVGEGVLCPRSDTELLCLEGARLLREIPCPQVLDLCAGTGCVGIGIKSLVPAAQVTCLEKSSDALEYLAENCRNYGVNWEEGDLFGYQEKIFPASLDLITANPPYLTEEEMANLQPEVAHEPAMALDGGKDGLLFYRYLATRYQECLKPGGWLAVEIGWEQGQAVSALLNQSGWIGISVRQDLEGRDRVVLARRPGKNGASIPQNYN